MESGNPQERQETQRHNTRFALTPQRPNAIVDGLFAIRYNDGGQFTIICDKRIPINIDGKEKRLETEQPAEIGARTISSRETAIIGEDQEYIVRSRRSQGEMRAMEIRSLKAINYTRPLLTLDELKEELGRNLKP